MAPALVEHVVADAGAFIKRVNLQDIGRNIYTLKEVVEEIRDKATRRSLSFLPYQLIFKEPNPEHVRHVTEFSKKTGDYPSLSATDIKVLALTYQLELEHVGSVHLRKELQVQINVLSTQRHPEAPLNVAGFHFPSKKVTDAPDGRRPQTAAEGGTDGEQFNSFWFWREALPPLDDELLRLLGPVEDVRSRDVRSETDSQQFNSFLFWREAPPPLDEALLCSLSVGGASTQLRAEPGDSEEEEEEEEEEEQEEEENDGGGWITPSNIRQVKMQSSDWTTPDDVTVGCLTTDFAMQNVLIQIGLHAIAANGLVIQQARSHILRCHACFRTTSNMNKSFCPHCGNATLKKLAVTLQQDGSTLMHFSRNPKVLSARGLRHSLPLPRGGKHAANPHLVEDQRFPQQRLSRKARQKTDVFHPDYAAGGASPFCLNDVHSRAANLHIRDGQGGGGRRRANPNAARNKFVNKK
ncbi:unnamed protein product [Ophioblennius macclurei]